MFPQALHSSFCQETLLYTDESGGWNHVVFGDSNGRLNPRPWSPSPREDPGRVLGFTQDGGRGFMPLRSLSPVLP